MLKLKSNFSKLALASALLTSIGSVASAAVWEPKNSWSPQWEAQYENWVRTEWNKDYFVNRGPYQGMILDCADAVYGMRYIFAAQNSLPFVVNDPSGGRGTISQATTRYDKLPEAARKLAFFKYINGIVSTGTLVADSFPLATNRSSIKAGTFLRSDAVNHHSWTVKDVSRTGIPHLIFATRPASSKLYSRKEFPSMGFLFNNNNSADRAAGFRGFRTPDVLKTPDWQLPGYSLEQYQIPIKSWKETMNARLRLAEETLEEQIDRVMTDACSGTHERVGFVQEALDFQRKADAEGRYCLSAKEYDDSSTPSRDTRLRDSFVELETAIAKARKKGIRLNPDLQAKVDQYSLKERSGSLGRNSFCALEYRPQVWLAFGQVAQLSLDKQLSGDPNETIDVRWGQARGPTDRSARCPKY